MKKRTHWLLVTTLVLTLGACKKEEKAPAPASVAAPAPTAAVPVVPEPKPVIPALTAEERAAKLGFAKHLPADTEGLVSYYQGTETTKRVKSTKLWKFIQRELNDAEEPEPPTDPAVEEPFGPAALFGTEFSFALGKPSSAEFQKIGRLNSRNTYFQIRSVVKAFDMAIQSGDAAALTKALSESFSDELFAELLRDPKSGIDLVEQLQLPPLYFAFKVKEADREAAATQLASTIGMANMLGEMVVPATAESSGSKLTGVKILGSKISESLAADRSSMDTALTPEMADRVLAALAKKDIVLVSGSVGDYVVLFFGPSTEAFKLSPDSASSLCSGAALSFVDAFAKQELSALVYGEKTATDLISADSGAFADYIEGLRDGIAAAERLGDTRDLDAMFRILAEREEALRKLGGNEATGILAYFEDGLKIESVGGSDLGLVDYQASNKLAHLGRTPGVAFFANVSSDPIFQAKASDYFQALFETTSALSQLVAESPVPMEGLEKAREMTKLFNSQFRPDLLSLWGIYKNDFLAGIGTETAWVVDLKGTPPKIPGASEALLAEAKVPRISRISPVTDRAKLAESWTKMNLTFSSTLGKVGKLMGRDIPMQEPLSSEKNGATTWFFALPFSTNDFLPSITLNDRWFIASTSKNQATDLIAQADAGGASGDGLFLSIDFKALGSYAQDSLKLAEAHVAEFTGQPLAEQELKMLKSAALIFEDVDHLTLHSRRDGSDIRTSIHLKTR